MEDFEINKLSQNLQDIINYAQIEFEVQVLKHKVRFILFDTEVDIKIEEMCRGTDIQERQKKQKLFILAHGTNMIDDVSFKSIKEATYFFSKVQPIILDLFWEQYLESRNKQTMDIANGIDLLKNLSGNSVTEDSGN